MKKIKCANLYAVNDLRCEDIPMPECTEDEVLVEVKSAEFAEAIFRVYLLKEHIIFLPL